MRIVKKIKAGEELFVDYGKGYFDPDPCPCATCNPPASTPDSTSQPKQEIDGEAQRLAKNANKAAKRLRKKEGKSASEVA